VIEHTHNVGHPARHRAHYVDGRVITILGAEMAKSGCLRLGAPAVVTNLHWQRS
jgi:hypothetical protein